MKHSLKWGALGLCVYVVFLIIKLPAVQVVGHLSLPPEIKLQGVKGTIWQGQAMTATLQGLPVSNIKWSLDFWPLLIGTISADISAGNIRQVDEIAFLGGVSFASDRIQLNDVQAYLPTNLMISLLPLPFPVKAEGRFKLEVDELDYRESCQALSGKGQWLNAKVAGLEGLIDLGNFSADMVCENNNILLSVKEPNRFGLTAQATIPANLQFAITGRFKPDANLPEEVHQAAQFFGNKDAQGYYNIKF
ncbi:type II secretion system protein N [Paraglaciecola hydrolytica]|uniref:Type II secretion system protein N n=1 Tax=Paraglaciecola hydrolytica TaxID=1799789 RepID=A0A135ZZG2_9ALTE|nr:type II secretion system protein N [Paraglaciecola hydrolytica]KXI28280.1 general secretion pathway protein GspN [Paraglaciecola hydrolytica]